LKRLKANCDFIRGHIFFGTMPSAGAIASYNPPQSLIGIAPAA